MGEFWGSMLLEPEAWSEVSACGSGRASEGLGG